MHGMYVGKKMYRRSFTFKAVKCGIFLWTGHETRMCETRNAYRFWWGSCLNMGY